MKLEIITSSMVEAYVGGSSEQFLGHVVYALDIVRHTRVNFEQTVPKVLAGAVRNNILRPIEGAKLVTEFTVRLAAIPCIHEGEHRLLHLEEAAGVHLLTLGFGRDDAKT